MKITRNNYDGVDFRPGRKLGNSTRQVDLTIDLLFQGYIVEVVDHAYLHKITQSKEINYFLMDKVIKRLNDEFRIGMKDIEINRSNITIQLKPAKV